MFNPVWIQHGSSIVSPNLRELPSNYNKNVILSDSNNNIIKKIGSNMKYDSLSNELLVHSCIKHPNILSPELVSLNGETVITISKKGKILNNININPIEFTISILDALCYLEDFGIMHGDIKLDNIIEHEGKYKLIDFGLLPNINNSHHVSQTHRDINGYILSSKEIKMKEYGIINEAMYALGITIGCILNKNIKNDSSISVRDIISINEMRIELNMDMACLLIHKDLEYWLLKYIPEPWRDFIKLLIGKNRYKSFHEARDYYLFNEIPYIEYPSFPEKFSKMSIPKWENSFFSRYIYNFCSKNNIRSYYISCIYNIYYSCHENVGNEKKYTKACCNIIDNGKYNSEIYNIFDKYRGCHILFGSNKSEGRILMEYLEPGSWINTKNININFILKNTKLIDLPDQIILKNECISKNLIKCKIKPIQIEDILVNIPN